MKIFDIHAHIFPDKVAENAIKSLEASVINDKHRMNAFFDGTYSGLIKYMKQTGVTASLNLPVATTPEQVTHINHYAAKHNTFPIYSLGAIHPDTPNKRDALLQLKQLRLKGIKLHPEYQCFSFDDPRLQEIYAICEDLELLILFHCGYDCSFQPPFRSYPADLAEVLDHYPALKIIGGHFGGLEMWEEVEKYLIGRNIYLETSFFLGNYPEGRTIDMILSHAPDKLLFGSDTPWGNPAESIEKLFRLNLPQELTEKILWNNAIKLLELEL